MNSVTVSICTGGFQFKFLLEHCITAFVICVMDTDGQYQAQMVYMQVGNIKQPQMCSEF